MANKRHTVTTVIKARDEASRKFRNVGSAAFSMGSMIKKAAVAAGVYLGGRALYRFTKENISLFARQELAVKSLQDALNLLGKGQEIEGLRKYAAEIQAITVYGDEKILELMAMGSAMGRMHDKELKNSVKAAIGLAKAYGLDVVAAMRLVARARVGDTSSLTRYGIKIDMTLSALEKFNEVIKIGTRNFKLAEAEVDTTSGRIQQMKNAIGDVREELGGALAPTVKASAIVIRDWAKANKESIGTWAAKTVAAATLGKDIMVAFAKYMRTDWQTGFQFGLDATLTGVKTWGQQLMIIMEKIFTDLENNIGVWIKRGIAQKLDFKRYEKEFLNKYPGMAGMRPEVQEALKKQAREYAQGKVEYSKQYGVYSTAYPTQEPISWGQVGAEMKAVAIENMKDLVGRAPENLGKDLIAAWAKLQARLNELNAPPGKAPPARPTSVTGLLLSQFNKLFPPSATGGQFAGLFGTGPQRLAPTEARLLQGTSARREDHTIKISKTLYEILKTQNEQKRLMQQSLNRLDYLSRKGKNLELSRLT